MTPITILPVDKEKWEVLARLDENKSLLSVAEHEIALPDHCEMHNKYVSACYACKKRKWYGEISKDWKRVIAERSASLQARLAELEHLGGSEVPK